MTTTNGHKGRLERLAATIRARGESEYDKVPTRCMFSIDLFQAHANYDSAPPDVVAERVAYVHALVDDYDTARSEHELDIIGVAMVLPHHEPDLSLDASSIAATVTHTLFQWDMELHGRDYAFRHLRSRDRVTGVVASRLAKEGIQP